jgi:hypothetical protein
MPPKTAGLSNFDGVPLTRDFLAHVNPGARRWNTPDSTCTGIGIVGPGGWYLLRPLCLCITASTVLRLEQ